MADNGFRAICCAVLGDNRVFKVKASVSNDGMDLQKLVYEEGKHTVFRDTDPLSLILWKLNVSEPVHPQDTLSYRIGKRGIGFSGFAKRLSAVDRISDLFAQAPQRDHLHIVVEVPPADEHGSYSPPHKQLRTSKSSPQEPPPSNILRGDTVSALYQRLDIYKFIQVRGTPGSGKTSLAELLCQYIIQREPATNIIWIQGWPCDAVNAEGRWMNYFETKKGWVKTENTVFVFDEAQLLYVDGDLWNNFFKSMHTRPNCRAIVFASHGSPTTHIMIEGTPIFVKDVQRVTLRAIPHEDGLPPVGLFFTRAELDDLVSRLYPSPKYSFDISFFDGLFDLTQGHVGAMTDFMQVILAHNSYRAIRNTPDKSYSWNSFLEQVSPRVLFKQLEISAGIFTRGLPRTKHLQNPSVARIFEAVLRVNVVTDSDFTSGDERDALLQCFHNGWLHADKFDGIGDPDEYGYCFPSSLHRWYVEWKLCATTPSIPFDTTDILEFAVAVIRKFSPRLLATGRNIGPGFIQRTPEAHYQDEFYRCCHVRSKGCLVTFPEYGTRRGRVDFYIPSKQWGIELLRDGEQLEQHSDRFSSSGSYGATLSLSDHIILDFRVNRPVKPHPHLPKLYHVVFTDTFHTVSILDNKLNPVSGGEFVLLSSS